MYQYDGSSWNELYEVSAWTEGLSHSFGVAIALEGETAFISDPDESVTMNFAGCVWICTDLANPPTGVEETGADAAPGEFALHDAYPNPFNSTAVIEVSLPHRADLEVAVYNNLGQRVSTLTRMETNSGLHRVTFDATGLPGGVYFVRAEAQGQWHEVRKIVLIK